MFHWQTLNSILEAMFIDLALSGGQKNIMGEFAKTIIFKD